MRDHVRQRKNCGFRVHQRRQLFSKCVGICSKELQSHDWPGKPPTKCILVSPPKLTCALMNLMTCTIFTLVGEQNNRICGNHEAIPMETSLICMAHCAQPFEECQNLPQTRVNSSSYINAQTKLCTQSTYLKSRRLPR